MKHRKTSREAYELIGSRADAIRAAVAQVIRSSGDLGATDDEIQTLLKIDGNTQRPRRWELMGAGLVKDSGSTRLTRKDRAAIVWIWVDDPEEQEALKNSFDADKARRAVFDRVVRCLKAMNIGELEELLEQLEGA